jgi:sugar lactone lactonase YvrE
LASAITPTKAQLLPALALLSALVSPALAASVFTTRPEDAGAVYVTAQEFGVRGDGTSDDSGAIQTALDKAAATTNGNGGVVFVPSGRYRLTRTLYVWRGVRVIWDNGEFANQLDLDTFITAAPGQRVYVVSSAENRTYSATVRADGTLTDVKPFAERGGESVTVDTAGNVYVANGQIFVYNAAGNAIGRIDVPERPIGVLFGGPDRRTLFILAHHTLYAVKMRVPGEPLDLTR